MATRIESKQGQDTHNLEAELEQLRHEVEEKRRRSSGVALTAIFALLLASAALVAATLNSNDNQSGGTNPTTAPVQAAPADTTVSAQLGEMFIKPSVSSVSAGKVTFDVTNNGATTHEMVVIRTNTPAAKLPTNAAGEASEKGSVGEVSDLGPGKSDALTVNLKPGHYALICNLPGHYKAGMFTDLTVR